MKIKYSKTADALYVQFREDSVAQSKEIEEGVIVDFDRQGKVIGIEILHASRKMKPEDLANFKIEDPSA